MLHNSQINRLLTSIVASMVVLSAVATVEVQLPRHEVEEIACRLRASYNELMSDRAGQEALNRLLRQQSSQLKQEIKKHVAHHCAHQASSACCTELGYVVCAAPVAALQVPACAPSTPGVAASPIKIRAPGYSI